MTVHEVADRLAAIGTELVVISGGEPLNQQRRLLPLIERLRASSVSIEIETNGTAVPDPAIVAAGVRFNVSPKLAHSGVREDRRIVESALRAFAEIPDTAFKFVCAGPADLAEVDALVSQFSLRNIWIMPVGQTSEEITNGLRALAEPVTDRRWNLSGRLHVLLWQDKRGV